MWKTVTYPYPVANWLNTSAAPVRLSWASSNKEYDQGGKSFTVGCSYTQRHRPRTTRPPHRPRGYSGWRASTRKHLSAYEIASPSLYMSHGPARSTQFTERPDDFSLGNSSEEYDWRDTLDLEKPQMNFHKMITYITQCFPGALGYNDKMNCPEPPGERRCSDETKYIRLTRPKPMFCFVFPMWLPRHFFMSMRPQDLP